MCGIALFSDSFMDDAGRALPNSGLLAGSDGDFWYVLLDGNRYDMGVLDCRDEGLVDGVAMLARPPAVVMNAQFIDSPLRRRPEGQVVRDGKLVVKSPKTTAWYVAQVNDERGMAKFRVGAGNPWQRERQIRDALGGLGPVISNGRIVHPVAHWVETIYAKEAGVGRGVIALDRRRSLVLILVQRDRSQGDAVQHNARSLAAIRTWLVAQGISEAVFNDGGDSEGLAIGGEWQCKPALHKQLATGFALTFTDTRVDRRAAFVALDGTPTADASTFVKVFQRIPRLLYPPRNVAHEVVQNKSSLAGAVRFDVFQTWRLSSQAGARSFQRLIREARAGKTGLDFLYLSGHATRHGKLVYHRYGASGGREYVAASVWDPSFKTEWERRPRWIVLAGCAVLSLRYSRLVTLDANELVGLIERHREIHGIHATIQGLRGKSAAWEVYHPGWAWYSRALRRSGVRGILGYWYRSPGKKGGDIDIIKTFAQALVDGRPFLDAWRSANQRGFFSNAAWAAMVRDGSEQDTLETLFDASREGGTGEFLYHDEFQSGNSVPAAYQRANKADNNAKIGNVLVSSHSFYDRVTLKDDPDRLGEIAESLAEEDLLRYDDGVQP